jgi:hypothetical protein
LRGSKNKPVQGRVAYSRSKNGEIFIHPRLELDLIQQNNHHLSKCKKLAQEHKRDDAAQAGQCALTVLASTQPALSGVAVNVTA